MQFVINIYFFYSVLFSSRVRVGITVRIRFNAWLVSCYVTLGCNCLVSCVLLGAGCLIATQKLSCTL